MIKIFDFFGDIIFNTSYAVSLISVIISVLLRVGIMKISKEKSKMRLFIIKYIFKFYDNDSENNTNKSIIVEEIYEKKKKIYNRALSAILLCILIYCIKNILFNTEINMAFLIFLYVLVGLIMISRILISYRISKGYYGTNYEESKEILYYLLEDKDKNDKNSGKKIFNEIEERNNLEEKLPVSGGNLEY